MPDINKALQQFAREEEEEVTQALATKLKLPYVNLMEYQPAPDVLQTISPLDAGKYHVVPYLRVGAKIKVASPTPDDPKLLPYLKTVADTTNRSIVLAVCSQSSYRYMLSQYQFVKEAPESLEYLEVEKPLEQSTNPLKTFAEVRSQLAHASITKLSEVLFAGALAVDASDIHLEPRPADFRVRYRIDGVLQDVVSLSKDRYKPLRDRIKYLAQLKLDTANIPQDGRFDLKAFGRALDVRVSALPGAFGEVIVLRILDPQGKLLTLDQLGFRAAAQKAIAEAIAKPNGVIMNTGPTGSGKTTTLYALIQKLNKSDIKIVTLEDPIEYRIPGVDQSQIKPSKGYTFATGLRSVLRQDPDIIMVGEIRDLETAGVAIQSSLTGHLVLSTLHTNDSAGAITRLIDMNVEPFLISSTLESILAQRLVRTICKKCKVSFQPDKILLDRLNLKAETVKERPFYYGKGCDECHETGYRFRKGIYEYLVVSEPVRQLINEKKPTVVIRDKAIEQGMALLRDDGIRNILDGYTTADEVLRWT